ncbi:MAG: RluA family pseudouridine synthase [Deltaproteobacteria bacterium]|nr:RluA family pseudouridine synthase [Candidatus Anaeroferrophillacea bacterium]
MTTKSQENGPRLTHAVAAADAGSRLDQFLNRKHPEISVRRWRGVLERVRVDDRPASKGMKLTAGSRVTLPARLPTELLPGPAAADDSVSLEIIHEDRELVALFKPAGVHCHPQHRDETGTIANALVRRYPEMARFGFDPLQPGLLNRLDHETSGVLLAARSEATWNQARNWFAGGRVHKVYLGIVHGHVRSRRMVELPLIHQPGDPRRMTTTIPAGYDGRVLPAKTVIEPLKTRRHDSQLVRLTMRTGVMHQLRVHLACAGHPLVGDRLYGRPETAVIDRLLGRLFLHSHMIRLPDGRTFTAEPDWDWGGERG